MPLADLVFLTGESIPCDKPNICRPRVAVCVNFLPIFTPLKNKQTAIYKAGTALIWVSQSNGVVNRLLMSWKQYKKAPNTTQARKERRKSVHNDCF